MPPDPKKDFDTATLLNEHEGDIYRLGEKVAKCYSTERYAEFQDAVETIVLRTIDGTGREKIKVHSKESAKEFNLEDGWTKKKFWIPVVVSLALGIISTVVSIWVVYHHL